MKYEYIFSTRSYNFGNTGCYDLMVTEIRKYQRKMSSRSCVNSEMYSIYTYKFIKLQLFLQFFFNKTRLD